MGIVDSIKGMFTGHGDTVNQGVDAAAGAAKDAVPDQLDGAVDQGAAMAKDAISKELDT